MTREKTKNKQKQSSQSLNGEVISVKISVDLVFPFGKLGKPQTHKTGVFFRAAFDGSSHDVVVYVHFTSKNKNVGTIMISDPKGDNLRANYISADFFRKVWCYAILSSG